MGRNNEIKNIVDLTIPVGVGTVVEDVVVCRAYGVIVVDVVGLMMVRCFV